MRLIYSLQYTEWCYYRKINVPLVVLWGWMGCMHICSHNTTADLAVRERTSERERERGCGENGRACCLSELYQTSLFSQTCDIRLWVSQPAGAYSSWENASVCRQGQITFTGSCKAQSSWMIVWIQIQEYLNSIQPSLFKKNKTKQNKNA